MNEWTSTNEVYGTVDFCCWYGRPGGRWQVTSGWHDRKIWCCVASKDVKKAKSDEEILVHSVVLDWFTLKPFFQHVWLATWAPISRFPLSALISLLPPQSSAVANETAKWLPNDDKQNVMCILQQKRFPPFRVFLTVKHNAFPQRPSKTDTPATCE